MWNSLWAVPTRMSGSDFDQEDVEHDEEDRDGNDDDVPEDTQEFTEQEAGEAFLAGWRAKKKTSDQRKQRGFLGAPRSDRVESSQSSPGRADARKTNSRCADCKGLGHWRGDPECPLVQSGQVPKFEKPVKKAHYVRWLGMVSKVEPVRVVKAEHVREDLWHVHVGFIHKKLVDHVLGRLSKKKPIFFGTKSQGGLIDEYVRKEPLSVTFFAKSRGELQVSVVQEAFMKVLGPIAKDLDVQQDLEVPSKKECDENDGVSSSYNGSLDSFASRRDSDERHRRQGRSRWYDHADIPQRERDEHHRDEHHREEQLGRDASPRCHCEDNRQQQVHSERRSRDASPRRYREERDSEGRRQQPAGGDQGADASPGRDVHDLQQVKRSRDESLHQASRARKEALVLAKPPGE